MTPLTLAINIVISWELLKTTLFFISAFSIKCFFCSHFDKISIELFISQRKCAVAISQSEHSCRILNAFIYNELNSYQISVNGWQVFGVGLANTILTIVSVILKLARNENKVGQFIYFVWWVERATAPKLRKSHANQKQVLTIFG